MEALLRLSLLTLDISVSYNRNTKKNAPSREHFFLEFCLTLIKLTLTGVCRLPQRQRDDRRH